MTEAANTAQNTTASRLLKVWYATMTFCTVSLYIIGIILKDSSVNWFVLLGIIAICITPVVRIIKAAKKLSELKERKEQKQMAAGRLANLSTEERQEIEKEKKRAAIEFAKRHAAKSESPQDVPKQ